jgi:hypothetical protein
MRSASAGCFVILFSEGESVILAREGSYARRQHE